jgi:xanthine dehydrogenase accessory factor
MTLTERLFGAIEREEERCVLFTVVEGEPLGAKLLVFESGETVGDDPLGLAALADELIRAARNKVVDHGGRSVFAEIFGPPPRLLVYGAVDSADALCAAARVLGWHTIVADARGMFATEERIPHADELIVAWPEDAFAQVGPDHATAIVVLTHDDKFDVPALMAAVRTEAFYIGALGSRRNQERRREKLLEAGVTEEEFARIAGPCGLDIGADTPAETGISILAEALAVRAGRDGGRLRDAKGRIHVEVTRQEEVRG